MRYFFFLLFFAAAGVFIGVQPASAGECFEHTMYELSGTAYVESAVFVRSIACMDGSEVIETLPTGATVPVLAEWDGWYKVSYNGVEGWVWQDFLTVTADPIGTLTPTEEDLVEEEEVTNEENVVKEEAVEAEEELVIMPIVEPVEISAELTQRLTGYILLQVEDHGEAWYVNPTDSMRYYMKDGPTAYEMMRSFGLGITDADLAIIPSVSDVSEYSSALSVCSSSTLAKRLAGRILLQVQQHGEAWYVDPATCLMIYMEDGDAAYEIMRYRGLGITNSDLVRIADEEIPLVGGASGQVLGVSTSDIGISISEYQGGEIPSNIDVVELNEYWLSKVNALRREAGLRELVLDQRFVDTATKWSDYMAWIDTLTHTDQYGRSMHERIQSEGLEFTERYSENGWSDNYFSENVSWDYVANSQESAEGGLDNSMSYFLAEASYNGPHYRTLYHPDWNSVGLGFYFTDRDNGSHKAFMTFHYGSLVLE